jgi:hypothetical protein
MTNKPTDKLPLVRPDLGTLLQAALQVGGETDGFDFKEILDIRHDEHKIRLVKAVAAFGNTDAGGYIWIGVKDDRTVVGLSDELVVLFDQTPVQTLINNYLSPPPTVQARQHITTGGIKLVVIEVSPFADVPCVVRQSFVSGKERLQAGTFIVRRSSAESAILTSEIEIRKLCDAIVNRRATAIAELLRKGLVGLQGPPSPRKERFAAISNVRRRAEEFWPSPKGGSPYIEVFFTPDQDLKLRGDDLQRIIPGACVPIRHGFPFYTVYGGPVETSMPWGWLGTIPFHDTPQDKPPAYLWMLDRNGAFLNREGFWEDAERSVIPGGIGLYHVAGELIRLVRFLDRTMLVLGMEGTTEFELGVVLNNVEGRYLENERSPWLGLELHRKINTETRIDASLQISLSDARAAREEVVVNLLAEVSWQFRKTEWKRQSLVETVKSASAFLGQEYSFPPTENIQAK